MFNNQVTKYCDVCDVHRLHTKGWKYYTCLTCATRTRKVIMQPKIKQSGTKHTVKTTWGIANVLSSIRSPKASPMKGTRNPSHVQIKIPKIGK